MQSVMIKGKLIRVGDKLIGSEDAPRIGIPEGRTVEVAVINRSGSGIGVADTKRNKGWHNLDGALDSGSGYWVDKGDLHRYFKLQDLFSLVKIKGDFSFRKKDLKGKKGKVLATLPNCEESMVEFEEFVEGCSCDGLGKSGHCLVVPHSLLESVEIKESAESK